MAMTPRELHSVISTGGNSTKRYAPTAIRPCTIGAGATAIAALTPMAFNTATSEFVPFASGGANGTGTIVGFAPSPDGIVRDAVNQVLDNVVLGGTIHLDDIPIIAGYTLAQLKTAIIASELIKRQFKIDGLPDFH